MHEAIANITFNSNKIPISKEQIKAILDYFFDKLGTNLQMGFFPYVVYNFLKLLIGSPRNHF